MLTKLVLKKETSSIFLAIVLLLGTIALTIPSFSVEAQATSDREKDYDKYEDKKSSYNKDDYKSEYSSYDKYKKDSNSVSINKLNCINTNININGDNSGNVNVGNKGQLPTSEDSLTANAYSGNNNGERYNENGYNKNHKDFDCIINNNNNNTNIITGGGNQTIPPVPPEQRTTLNVTKNVACGATGPTTVDCSDITPANFTISVLGSNPVPNSFPGSATGTQVAIGLGGYTVTEAPNAQLQALIASGDMTLQTTFAGGCSPAAVDQFSATGAIEAGISEICNITNTITLGGLGGGATGLPLMAQGTADSADLTAMEKITKLKTQWLNQLS